MKPHIAYREETVVVDIPTPRSAQYKFVEVGLDDVRAADNVRISYDFERDGWKIEQARFFSWPEGAEPDPGWIEVAFVQAWGSEVGESL